LAITKKAVQDRVLRRQLELTGYILDAVERAIRCDDQLFRYIEFVKGKEEASFEEHTGGTLNEKRLFEITRALEIIFELQRMALEIPVFKERSDADMARAKLNFEKKKHEAKTMTGPPPDDGFLDAITAAIGGEQSI